ncbi:MAG TPA: energy transducer TonB [Usitatibacter sp.]
MKKRLIAAALAATSLITVPVVKAAPATSNEAKVENADPEKVSGERPSYPEEARQSGVEGKLTAWLHVDAKGNVTQVEIKESPGDLFSEEAVAKFSKWKFKPEVKKGRAIAFIGEYTIIFRLKDGQPFVSNS